MAHPFGRARGFVAAFGTYMLHPDAWEDVCDRCARCCFERELTDEGEVIVNFACPCEFLDSQTRLCSVYDTRFSQCEGCHKLTPFTVFFGGHLPDECAYVRTFMPSADR